MKTLIVEDDFTSRLLLQEFLRSQGISHIAVNGKEALQAFRSALESGVPYDLICLDIMMPEMNGHEVLKAVRSIEAAKGMLNSSGVKILMTTALDDMTNVTSAYRELCDGYLVKPIDRAKLFDELLSLGLIA
jgi:two-component system, chemotaxis family, chemotaxis protein CheY